MSRVAVTVASPRRTPERPLVPDLLWTFGAEPLTGTVYYVLPDGEAWFANSSISLWLPLHHYGRHVSQSETLNDPDEHEDEVIAELSRPPAEQYRPSCGPHQTPPVSGI